MGGLSALIVNNAIVNIANTPQGGFYGEASSITLTDVQFDFGNPNNQLDFTITEIQFSGSNSGSFTSILVVYLFVYFENFPFIVADIIFGNLFVSAPDTGMVFHS